MFWYAFGVIIWCMLLALVFYPATNVSVPSFVAFAASDTHVNLKNPPTTIDDVVLGSNPIALLAQNSSAANGLYVWNSDRQSLVPTVLFAEVGDCQAVILYGSEYGNSQVLYSRATQQIQLALSTAIVNSVTQVGDLYVKTQITLANAEMEGLLNGADVNKFNNRLNGMPPNIGDITNAQCDQIANIDASTIGSDAWLNVGMLDQPVSTTSTPTFGALTSAVQPFTLPQSVTLYESSGSVNIPSTAKAAMVQVQGGGGAGGGQGTADGSLGAGGGSGAFVQIVFQVSDLAVQTGFDFTIGAGGTVGAGVSDDGGDGGDTILAWQGGATLVTAFGGGGGKSGATNGQGGAPGATPTVSGGFASLTRTGNWGFRGYHPGSSIVNIPAGDGANTLYGSGGRGAFSDGDSQAGSLGGGGGGGFLRLAGDSRDPSDGGTGYIRIFWY